MSEDRKCQDGEVKMMRLTWFDLDGEAYMF